MYFHNTQFLNIFQFHGSKIHLKTEILLNIKLLDMSIYGKKNFAEIFKNLAKYRSENNFVWTIKVII